MRRFERLHGIVAVCAFVGLVGCGGSGGGSSDGCASLEARAQSCFDVTLQQLLGEPCIEPSGIWAAVRRCQYGCVADAVCADFQTLACNDVFPPAVADCFDACEPAPYVCADGSGTHPYDYQCDGWEDCNDGADEEGCPAEPTWACATGPEEIPLDWRCDAVVDCGDGSDESVAECGSFACVNTTLIPATLECDGVPNCADGSDEHLDCGYLGVCAP